MFNVTKAREKLKNHLNLIMPNLLGKIKLNEVKKALDDAHLSAEAA